jgi:homoserine dehydrogenase
LKAISTYLIDAASANPHSHAVIIDASDQYNITRNYAGWAREAIHVVNQQNITSPLASLTSLPLQSTLLHVLSTGDRVVRVEAILPSALTYALTSPTSKVVLSDLVESPARVATVLAGIALELGYDVSPASVSNRVNVSSLKTQSEADNFIAKYRNASTGGDSVYQYVSSLEFNGTTPVMSSAIKFVPKTHSFACMRGKQTIVAVYTHQLGSEPILLQAPVKDDSAQAAFTTDVLDYALARFTTIVKQLAQ